MFIFHYKIILNSTVLRTNYLMLIMDIAIVDKSELSSLRLGSIVSGIKGVNTIIQILHPGTLLEILNKTKPAVIIYDLNSNGQNNLPDLQKIRELLPNTTIIALTSYSPEQYRRKCKEMGIIHCLDKINEFERIPEIITELRTKMLKQ